MNSTNNKDKYWIVILLVVFGVIIYMVWKRNEGFNNLTADQYYSWRTWDPNPNDYKRMTSFPYTYHPYEYPQPFNCYGARDVIYGYGTW